MSELIEINGELYEDTIENYRYWYKSKQMTYGPITRRYNWPGRHQPRKDQVITTDFMTRHDRGFVFNGIGTGKTLIQYWYYDFLKLYTGITSMLIVTPISIMQSTHELEIMTSFPHLKYQILYGSKEKRLANLKKKADIYIINYDGLGVILDELVRKQFDCIIFDEIAILKNQETNLWHAAFKLARICSTKYVWGFTGSPTPNSPLDCYAQARLINPKALPQTYNAKGNRAPIPFGKFKYLVMRKKSLYEWEPLSNWMETCRKVLQPSIRFELKDCVSLPSLTTVTTEVALTNKQTTLCKEMIKKLKIEVQAKTITAINAAGALLKLLQITSGLVYTNKKEVVLIDIDNRINEVRKILSQTDQHIIIFTPFRELPKLIAERLKDYKTACITAATPKNQRTQYYTDFTKGDLRVLIAMPYCMAHGLNLQNKCATIIWWSPIYSYMIYEQACGRIVRSGQLREQSIVHLQGGAVEKKLYARLKNKESAQKTLLSLLKEVPNG